MDLLELDVETLALTLSDAGAQPQGAAGAVDWRLGGLISRLIISGTFTAQENEQIMLSFPQNMGPKRVFLFGVGASGGDRQSAAKTLLQADVKQLAVGLLSNLNPLDDVKAWLHALAPWSDKLSELRFIDVDGQLVRSQAAIAELAQTEGWDIAQLRNRPDWTLNRTFP